MSNLSKETRDRIDADALKYAEMIPDCLPHISYRRGALSEAERAQQPLIDLLDEARLQIEYLHEKFGATGSGNNVLARIDTALAKYKEVGNGK